MNTKYIISLGMLFVLTGASCWGAAQNDEQITQRQNNQKLTELFAPQEARGDIPKIPDEIIEDHMLKFMSAATLMNLAVARPNFYPFIKKIPQFIKLQQNLKKRLQNQNGDLQKLFFDATRNSWNINIDIFDYLTLHVNINALDRNGDTAFRLVMFSYPWMLEMLLDRGADFNARTSIFGDTALICAARCNRPEQVKILLNKGADISLTNDVGLTALDIAEDSVARNMHQPYQNNARAIVNLLTRGD